MLTHRVKVVVNGKHTSLLSRSQFLLFLRFCPSKWKLDLNSGIFDRRSIALPLIYQRRLLFGATTLSLTTVGIMTLSIKGLSVTVSIMTYSIRRTNSAYSNTRDDNIQHFAECNILFVVTLNVIMLNVIMLSVVAPTFLASRRRLVILVFPAKN